MFILQPLRDYSLYERYYIDLYGLTLFAIDMIHKSNPKYLIHRIIVSSAFIVDIFYPFHLTIYRDYYNTEWSTLLLLIMPYITNSNCNQTHQIIFSIVFFKFRVYDLYYLLQLNPISYIHMIPLLCMYSLNLYWWIITCKTICKPLEDKLYTTLHYRYNFYPMILNFFLLTYRTFHDSCYLILQLTTFTSGMSTYLYYNDIEYVYRGIPSVKSIWVSIDITAFHLFQLEYMRLKYTEIFKISCILHFINVLYIYKYKYDISKYSMVAVLVDNLYILYCYPNIELFTILLLFTYVYVLTPMYELSFIVNHALVSWYMYFCGTRVLTN
jgi:hypothetical protein